MKSWINISNLIWTWAIFLSLFLHNIVYIEWINKRKNKHIPKKNFFTSDGGKNVSGYLGKWEHNEIYDDVFTEKEQVTTGVDEAFLELLFKKKKKDEKEKDPPGIEIGLNELVRWITRRVPKKVVKRGKKELSKGRTSLVGIRMILYKFPCGRASLKWPFTVQLRWMSVTTRLKFFL